MEMIKVESSNVVAVGYKKNDLYVDFKSGSYVYFDVPKEIYDGLLKAESKGKYMWAKVRDRYDYARLDNKYQGGNPNTSRSGAEVARRAHNPKAEGSIPSSATKSPIPGGQDIVIEWFDSTMVPINYREVPMDKELKVSRRGA